MPRQNVDARIQFLRNKLARVEDRRDQRHVKYQEADVKDVDRERALRKELITLQVTADNAAELDARIAEEVAKFDAGTALDNAPDDDVNLVEHGGDHSAWDHETNEAAVNNA